MRGYATAAVCRDFPITPLVQKVLQVEFSNSQCMFIITKACMGLFLVSFEKQDGRHRGFFDSNQGFLHILRLFLIYGKLNLFNG